MRQQRNHRHDRKSVYTFNMPLYCCRFSCLNTLIIIIISLIFITQQQLDMVCIDAFSVNTNNVNPKSTSSSSSSSASTKKRTTFLIIGGTGKVGSAVAKHLLQRQPNAHIILSGRRPLNEHQMNKVLQELQQEPQMINNNDEADTGIIEYVCQDFDQTIHTTTSSNTVNTSDWVHIFKGVDCIIHTAGPYIDCIPRVLEVAIQTQVPVYIDVSDPLPYLEHGISYNHHIALQLNTTTAILAAGAYPGMSNVLGIETAKELMKITQQETIQDIRYNFFAAGLGGIGLVNLYITNIGFGDPIGLYENGRLHLYTALSGMILGTVDFFFPSSKVTTTSITTTSKQGYENDAVKARVGTKQVFAWPFPEGATVPTQLRARGSSSVAMGVAPDLWNTILGLLVSIVPRPWWRNHRFSQFMADFSQPLVILTDQYMKWSDPNKVGETHCMRIDVTSCVNRGQQQQQQQRTMSTIQAHESLRTCVGQSCAEFALDCLEYPQPGVYYPEQRYDDDISRKRIIEKLTSTDGTFCFIGPIETTSEDNTKSTQPSNIYDAIRTARMMEENTVT